MLENFDMTEQILKCTLCREDKPLSHFMREDGKGPWKRCNPCRSKSTQSWYAYQASKKSKNADVSPNQPAPKDSSTGPGNESTIATRASTARASTALVSNPLTSNAVSQLHTRHDRDTRSITIAPQVITATGGVTSSTTIVTITTTTYPKADDSVELESQNESCSEADDEDATSVRSESSQSENYSHGASDLHHGKYSHSISGLHDIIGSHGVTHSHDANSFRGENITDGPGSFVCIHCERRQPALLQGFSVCLLCISDWRWCKSGNHNRPGAEFMWDRAEHDRCIHCLLDIISL